MLRFNYDIFIHHKHANNQQIHAQEHALFFLNGARIVDQGLGHTCRRCGEARGGGHEPRERALTPDAQPSGQALKGWRGWRSGPGPSIPSHRGPVELEVREGTRVRSQRHRRGERSLECTATKEGGARPLGRKGARDHRRLQP